MSHLFIYPALIALCFLAAWITWEARCSIFRNPKIALASAALLVILGAENLYYWVVRLTDMGAERSEWLWFMPMVLLFKLLYAGCLVRVVLGRLKENSK